MTAALSTRAPQAAGDEAAGEPPSQVMEQLEARGMPVSEDRLYRCATALFGRECFLRNEPKRPMRRLYSAAMVDEIEAAIRLMERSGISYRQLTWIVNGAGNLGVPPLDLLRGLLDAPIDQLQRVTPQRHTAEGEKGAA